MDLKEFDLKRFREERLKLTQEELARLLDVRQEQISRLEKSPVDMSLDRFLQLCDVAQMTPNQVLGYKLRNPDPVPMTNPYIDTWQRKDFLMQYLQPWRARLDESSDPLVAKANEHLDRIDNLLATYGAKPLLAFLGRSDAGKSRMINALTGTSKLPAEWQPTTSIRVYVKHAADKPSWMAEEVWVFKKPSAGSAGWDFRRFTEETYCSEWKLEAGSTDVLAKYGTRQGSKSVEQEAGAAVVFIDAPILMACDIVDLPGFGTGDREEDDIEAQRGREQADSVVYLSPANSFMNAEDITFLKQVLRDLAPVEYAQSGLPPLANLLVVASQAHIPDEEDLPTILQTGAERLYGQVSRSVWEERTAATGVRYTLDDFRTRFHTFTLDNGQLREDFVVALTQMLADHLPGVWRNRVNNAVIEAKDAAVHQFETEVQRISVTPEHREAALAHLEELRSRQPELQEQLNQAKNTVYTEIQTLTGETRLKFEFWYNTYVTPEMIEAIIREREYTKRQAQEFLGGNVNDLCYAKVRNLLEQGTNTLNRQVQHYLNTFEQGVTSLTAVSLPGADIPFDTRGALAGGLAVATVLGGFGVWAASLGSVGASILVSKGLSLLGALGVTIGGGSAAINAMVSSVGDPVAFAVSMAVGLGLLMKWALGEKWQARLATKLHDAMKEKGIAAQYAKVIETYWAETSEGFRQVTASMEKQLVDELEAQQRLLVEDNPERINMMLTKAQAVRNMFAGLPWVVQI